MKREGVEERDETGDGRGGDRWAAGKGGIKREIDRDGGEERMAGVKTPGERKRRKVRGGRAKGREACCRLTEGDGQREKKAGGGTAVSLNECERHQRTICEEGKLQDAHTCTHTK